METIYRDRQGGTWVYWLDNHDTGGRIYLTASGVNRLLRKGYRLVSLA